MPVKLKIKDNVDLKELEKYGFKRNKTNFVFYTTNDITYSSSDGHFKYCWWVEDDTRELKMYINNDDNYPKLDIEWFDDKEYATTESVEDNYVIDALVVRGLDILFDLIQAGLVKKVVE